MKKKILAITLCVAMLAVMLVSGTLAYFTDKDAATNTFTTGKVEIEQLERQYDEQGNLVDFVQEKVMVPAVGTEVCDDKTIDGHVTHYLDKEEMRNVQDKIVNVKNKSTVNIYAATLIAVEDTNDVSEHYKFVVGDTTDETGYWTSLRYNGATSGNNIQIKAADGTVFTVSIKIYADKIAPEACSPAILSQVYMKPATTQEDVEDAGATYDIHCLSLGVQADGFDDAQTAIESGFGFDVEKIDADMAQDIADMFGAGFTAGYYNNGGFTPFV